MSSDSVSIHTAILPALNVSLYVALTAELPLQRDVMEWIREDGELINKIIQGISILTKNNEICYAIFPNDNMIYRVSCCWVALADSLTSLVNAAFDRLHFRAHNAMPRS